MPETHYIEIDEEIIGAVGRLRKSNASENIFIFPKRALILQSIINLKLLGREAEKLGKVITVMSQDEQGMRLAEKAGLRVAEYHDAVLRDNRQESDARFTVKHGETIPMPAKPINDGTLRRSTEIGSTSFYSTPPAASTIPPQSISEYRPVAPAPMVGKSSAPHEDRTIRVRDRSPSQQTALNSKRDFVSAPRLATPTAGMATQPILPPGERSNGPMESTDLRKEKLRRLFQQPALSGLSAIRPTDQAEQILRPKTPITPSRGEKSGGRSKTSWSWLFLSLVLIAGIVFGGYFFLRPEATVIIEPQESEQAIKRSFFGMVGAGPADEAIPARYIEEEKTVRFTRPATGKDLGNAAKASGTITIINNHSTAAQSLVATTRFETTDGKLYRLAESVTVPGAVESDGTKTPGKIDARVVADSTGMNFNISSGITFRIPGFKSGPKYETITAVSKTAFTGGGDGTGGEALSVSAADLDLAKEAGAEEAKKVVFAGLESSLAEGESVLEKSFQVSLIGTPITAPVGTVVASSFEYEARFQVRGFIISTTALKSRIDQETIVSDGVTLKPHVYEIGYGTVLANFETKRVDFTVENKIIFRAPLDETVLKSELLGLNEEGIRTFLGSHPEIKRLQVEFKPKVFIATIPKDPNRVTLEFRSAEENE